jgi:predicted nucleic acid-binding protein
MDLLRCLFTKIHIAPSVIRELMKVEQMGLTWIVPVRQAVELLPLTEGQNKEAESLVVTYPQLGIGEIESLVLAKAHHLICLTNDRQAKRVCQALEVPCLDLEEILRALKIKDILSSKVLEEVIDQIEEKDHTRIKAKKHILHD